MNFTVLFFLGSVFGAALAAGEPHKVAFEQEIEGRVPRGFVFANTAEVGKPGRWEIRLEDSKKCLAQLEPDRTRSRFPVAVLGGVTALDGDLSVSFKTISGKVDQAAGLVWRFQDRNNYYLVRANALEDNVVLYKVEAGKRIDLPLAGEGRTYGKDVEVPGQAWSTLRVAFEGRRFEVYLDGKKLFEVEDDTFTTAGRVGVWTKADSVTCFADLTIAAK